MNETAFLLLYRLFGLEHTIKAVRIFKAIVHDALTIPESLEIMIPFVDFRTRFLPILQDFCILSPLTVRNDHFVCLPFLTSKKYTLRIHCVLRPGNGLREREREKEIELDRERKSSTNREFAMYFSY